MSWCTPTLQNFFFLQCAFADDNGGPLTLCLWWREFRSCPRICPSAVDCPLEYAGREMGFVVQKIAWGYDAFLSHLIFSAYVA